MKQIAFIVSGILAVLIGLGFVMPAVAQWRDLGTLPGTSVALLVLGLSLTTAGLVAGVAGVRRR
ncbi:hypothetical protein GC207_08130 [bacterium]|nr:hypothetical protein [bacterium]